MAKVYLAQDPVVDRRVALKVISPLGPVDAVTWQTLRTRFLLEARAAGKLQHPNAVAIYDADTDEETGLSYIAMEWVDGRSLDMLLKTRGPIDIETTIPIIQQVASALDAAHQQGLIHRDVKPANILIAKDGQAKLSDFGIVKFEDLRLTSTGGVMGTPLYMSPEQIRGKGLDGRSDLFSLGAVLYQCLTGSPPFSGDTLAELTYQIQHYNPQAPQWVNPSIPGGLASAILKSIAKDPGARPQTGADFSRHLEMAISGPAHVEASAQPVPVVTSTLPMSQTEIQQAVRGTQKTSRKSTVLLVGFAIIALLVVVALFLDNSTIQAIFPPPVTTQETPPPVDATVGSKTDQHPDAQSDPATQQPAATQPEAHPDRSIFHQSSQPEASDDDWIDQAEEVIDDAERVYKVSVGKGKEWWKRASKKKGASKDKKEKKN
jgi:serine/threonine protein kinase